MDDELKSFQAYIHATDNKLANGDYTGHTHRAALGILIASLSSGIGTANEPKHIEYVTTKGVLYE